MARPGARSARGHHRLRQHVGSRSRDAWDRLIADEAGRGGRLLLLAARDERRPWQLRALIRFGDPLRDRRRPTPSQPRPARESRS